MVEGGLASGRTVVTRGELPARRKNDVEKVSRVWKDKFGRICWSTFSKPVLPEPAPHPPVGPGEVAQAGAKEDHH